MTTQDGHGCKRVTRVRRDTRADKSEYWIGVSQLRQGNNRVLSGHIVGVPADKLQLLVGRHIDHTITNVLKLSGGVELFVLPVFLCALLHQRLPRLHGQRVALVQGWEDSRVNLVLVIHIVVIRGLDHIG